MSNKYRSLPGVDHVLSHPVVEGMLKVYEYSVILEAIRREIATARQAIASGGEASTIDEIADKVALTGLINWQQWPKRVINATGVILHTNLGRAPLSNASVEAIAEIAGGYSSLEFDLAKGQRGSRHQAVAELLKQLTGAEDALVVNNNASALLLGLTALTEGRQVIVSRGEAVEIGGGFRIPDVLRQSGAHLIEVGTTNRTYARDYAEAISIETAALLAVHRSNFLVVGFTENPRLEELASVAHERDLPLLHDLGSGALVDTAIFGLTHEPMPQESIGSGADLTFFSGDKLLGGPQAGIITGKHELVRSLARHPMARAVRIDKLNLASLHATLLHYIRGEAIEQIPVLRMLSKDKKQLKKKALLWAKKIGDLAEVEAGMSTIGGGSLPGEEIGTWVVGIKADRFPGGATGLASRLLEKENAIIVRIDDERVLLDPRTVLEEEEEVLLAKVKICLHN